MGLFGEFLHRGVFQAGRMDGQRDLEAEALQVIARAETDFRGHVGFRREARTAFAGDEFQRAQKARGVTGGEELLGVGPGAPLPPISLGVVSVTARTPSAVLELPSRPPVEVAWVE